MNERELQAMLLQRFPEFFFSELLTTSLVSASVHVSYTYVLYMYILVLYVQIPNRYISYGGTWIRCMNNFWDWKRFGQATRVDVSGVRLCVWGG